MESANPDLFAVTLDILKSDGQGEFIAELETGEWERLYSSDSSCYWRLISPFGMKVLANLTLGEEPILHIPGEDGELVRVDWDYWFGPAVDDNGFVLSPMSKKELFAETARMMLSSVMRTRRLKMAR